MSRKDYSRRFCFTWNNYPETAEAQIRAFHTQKQAVYTIVGRETGKNGTPHLQGYFHLKDRMGFTQLKKLFPTMHIEKASGNASQNKTYCSKEQNFFEMGTCPKTSGDASRDSWRAILEASEKGNWDFIKTNHPRVWVTMSEKLISKRIPTTQVLETIENEWWYGPTGTGKSRLAWEKYGLSCYQKMLNKWWDGYDDQPVVVVEEWSPKNEVTASALKIWADRYPFTAQIKGGVLQKIRPKKIVVISNYRLRDCFPDSRDAEPLARRFREISFPDSCLEAASRANSFLARVVTPTYDIIESLNASDACELDLQAIMGSLSQPSSEDEPIVNNTYNAASAWFRNEMALMDRWDADEDTGLNC